MKGQVVMVPRNAGVLFIVAALLSAVLFSVPPAYAQHDGQGKAPSLLKGADTLLEEGSVDKAIETVKKAIAEDPDNPEAYDKLGYMLLQKERPDDAIAAFTSALKIRPGLRTAKTGIGLSLLKK
jgi:Flp pilus assembly protein TadD